MNIYRTIEYDWDAYIFIEKTHGEVIEKYKATMRDHNISACGNTEREAVERLVQQLRNRADLINKHVVSLL